MDETLTVPEEQAMSCIEIICVDVEGAAYRVSRVFGGEALV